MKKFISIIVILIAIIALAWHRMAHADTNTINSAQSFTYCPKISQITKNPNKMNWYASTKAGYWKSYNLSFATDLTQFVGAQWEGENVGQMFCVYRSEQKFMLNGQPSVQPTIAVTLAFHTLTYVPSGHKWVHPKRGQRVCESNQQSDCPFIVDVQKKITDIYQVAESLKFQKPDRISLPSD